MQYERPAVESRESVEAELLQFLTNNRWRWPRLDELTQIENAVRERCPSGHRSRRVPVQLPSGAD